MPQKEKIRIFYSLLIITVVGLLLRIINLSEPLWVDEVCSWSFARRMPFAHMWQVALSDPTPPLYYSILHFVIRFTGENPAIMRLPSVFFGTLMIPATYWTMREGRFSRSDSLYAALICSVSSMLIFYSQELRAYILLAFCGVLSTGLLFRCLRDYSMASFLLYTVSIVILSFTHRYAFLLIFAQMTALIITKNWQVFKVLCAAGLLTLIFPLLQFLQSTFIVYEALDRVTGFDSVMALINMLNVGTIELRDITGLQPGPAVSYSQPAANWLLAVVGLVTFIIMFYCGWIKRKEYTSEQQQNIKFLIICILVPAVLALLAGSSLSPKPMWLLRGLLFIWPLYYMLAVIACSKARSRALLILMVVIINAGSLYPYYTLYNRFPYAPALRQLNSITTSDDLIVADQYWYYETINYYYRGPAQRAAYWKRKGWIDLEKLSTGDNPFQYPPPYTVPQPKATGNVYFFIGISNPAVIKEFSNNSIFVCDKNFNWQRYK
jgi:uncharacterized membrane protein